MDRPFLEYPVRGRTARFGDCTFSRLRPLITKRNRRGVVDVIVNRGRMSSALAETNRPEAIKQS